MDTKKVNIFPRGYVSTTNPPIRGAVRNTSKTIQDIRKCIIAGAKVEEVLPNGKVVLLNLTNYDLDNSNVDDGKQPVATKPGIDYNAAVGKRPGVAFSSPANVVVPTKSPMEKPVVTVEEPKPETTKVEEPVGTPEETPSVPVENPSTDEGNAVSQHMTRKQRRAMERAKAAEAAAEEPVEVQDVE